MALAMIRVGHELAGTSRSSAVTVGLAGISALGCAFAIGTGHALYALAFLGLLGLVVLLGASYRAMLLLIPVSMMGPLQSIPGMPIELGQVLALSLVASVGLAFGIGRIRWRHTPLDLPLLLLLLAHVFGLRQGFTDVENILVFLSIASLVGVFFATVHVVSSYQRLMRALSIFVGSAATVAAVTLAALILRLPSYSWNGESILLFGDWGGEGRLGGLYSQPNTFAQLLILAIPVAAALALEASVRRRLVWASAAAVTLTALLLTQSRSGVVAGLLSLLVVFVFQGRRHRMALVGLTAVLAAAAATLIAFSGSQSALERRLSIVNPQGAVVSSEPNYVSRSITFAAAGRIFAANPFGVGFRQSRPLIGEAVGLSERSVHNLLLTWAVELGILGLVVGLWFAVAQLWSLWQAIRVSHPLPRALMVGFFAAILGFWVHNMAHSVLHWLAVWIFFGLASSTALLVQEASQEARASRVNSQYAPSV